MKLGITLASLRSGIIKKAFFRAEYDSTWASIVFLKQFYAYLTVPVLFFTQPHRQINSYSSANRTVVATRAPEAISAYLLRKQPLNHNIFCLPGLSKLVIF
ncbi:MAG: hypothetical protein AMK69_12715 [Nitrospira bacterium SG8_3]|nr:MAG: hypothetical protein AMK69_12715 [Nitrospira bacterium SG8_3]